MSRIRGKRSLQLLFGLLVLALAGPVMAGLIYTWVDDVDAGVTGSISLADGIGFGDTFDPMDPSNIPGFQFLVGGKELGYDEFFTDAGLDFEPNALGLCSPNCDTHGDLGKKTAAKKKVGSDYVFFEPVITKQPAVKKGTPPPPPVFRWSYSASVTQSVVDTGGKQPAEKKGSNLFDGTGLWVLSSPVPVPEPGTLLLLLTGVAALTQLRKRLHAR